MHRQLRLSFGTALALVAACSDSLKPTQLSGLYNMTLVEGHAPPELLDTLNGYKTYVRLGWVLIKSDGTDTLIVQMDHGVTFLWTAWVYAGNYTISGDRLNFTNTLGTPLTYTGAAGPQALDVRLPFPLIHGAYTVFKQLHFEQVCEGDQCNFSSDSTL